MRDDSDDDPVSRQFDVSGWNLSNEREFMENLFVGRFNYFVLIFSIFLTAGFANNFETFRAGVFFTGATITGMVWAVLHRAYLKHDRTLRLIFRHFPDHPVTRTEMLMRQEGYDPRFRASKMMGVYIPAACTFLLVMAGVLVAVGVVR
jgi:hypothetical protein